MYFNLMLRALNTWERWISCEYRVNVLEINRVILQGWFSSYLSANQLFLNDLNYMCHYRWPFFLQGVRTSCYVFFLQHPASINYMDFYRLDACFYNFKTCVCSENVFNWTGWCFHGLRFLNWRIWSFLM